MVRTTAVLAALTLAVSVSAQPAPDYGLEWRTIGDLGNPAAQPADYFWLQLRGFGPVGRVDYEYRLTQTEITNTQWIEFVDAYANANPNVNINDLSFIGRDVYYTNNQPGNYGWYTTPGAENAGAQMGWFYAARYCNWLENGKSSEPSAFESGVYDMSSFVPGPNGNWIGDTQHAPGARYWLPSWDEWTKGMHWDPNKSGPGRGGYWLYPHSSDTPAVAGLPGTPGAQTSAWEHVGSPYFVPVGSYPTVLSPWGLLDGSGGVEEYLGFWVDGAPDTRGTTTGGGGVTISDRLDYLGSTGLPNVPTSGFRLASVVPAPYTLSTALLILVTSIRRARPNAAIPET